MTESGFFTASPHRLPHPVVPWGDLHSGRMHAIMHSAMRFPSTLTACNP